MDHGADELDNPLEVLAGNAAGRVQREHNVRRRVVTLYNNSWRLLDITWETKKHAHGANLHHDCIWIGIVDLRCWIRIDIMQLKGTVWLSIFITVVKAGGGLISLP